MSDHDHDHSHNQPQPPGPADFPSVHDHAAFLHNQIELYKYLQTRLRSYQPGAGETARHQEAVVYCSENITKYRTLLLNIPKAFRPKVPPIPKPPAPPENTP